MVCAFSLLLMWALVQPAQDLESAVRSFWGALEQGDIEAEVRLVAPASRKSYLGAGYLPIRSWQLKALEPVSSDSYEVVVEAVMLADRGALPVVVRQRWNLTDDGWLLDYPIVTGRSINEALFGRTPPAPTESTVSLAPGELVLHFLNPVQKGRFELHNGSREAIRVVSCDDDSEFLQVHFPQRAILPGQSEEVRVEVAGGSDQKELRAAVRCRIVGDSGPTEVGATVLFNHVSAAAKAFFGLSDEAVEHLRRGGSLTPALPSPQSPPGSSDASAQTPKPASTEPNR